MYLGIGSLSWCFPAVNQCDERRRPDSTGPASVKGPLMEPRGSGKSLSYWVPAVVDGGLTLVVSPLIALMKDQVDRLTERGVAATFINSSVDPAEQRERLRRALNNEYRLLFLAPE